MRRFGIEPASAIEQAQKGQRTGLRLVVTATQIEGEYTGVDKEGNVTHNVDSFETPVGG
jgi:hypothetical protein